LCRVDEFVDGGPIDRTLAADFGDIVRSGKGSHR